MMFEYLADDIAMLLIEKKIIDVKDRDLYCYGAEVLLLNLLNIIIALAITIISGTWLHFLLFMLLFIPLRICVGGYHAKTSQICLILSTVFYISSVLLVVFFPYLYQSRCAIAIFYLSIISIIIFAPVEHKNNPLDNKSRKINRTISTVLAILDSIIFLTLYFLNINLASSVMIFIILSALLMIVGKLVKK